MTMRKQPTTSGKRLRLKDGRYLGYENYGDPTGKPIFYFHGMPGSRLQRHPDVGIVASANVRVITIDRPGYGLSDFQPGRRLLDWPDDVVQLADALAIDKFAILGVSGGGPHAAACAFKIPQRLLAVAMVSSPQPLQRAEDAACMSRLAYFGLRLGRRAPLLLRPAVWLLSNPGRNPAKFIQQGYAAWPASDRAILDRPDFRAMLIADFTEAARQGVRAYWWDLVLLARPWGFRLGDITMPIHLWHGEEDNIVPVCMGRYLAAAIPNCRAHFLPGKGHFLAFEHLPEILAALTS